MLSSYLRLEYKKRGSHSKGWNQLYLTRAGKGAAQASNKHQGVSASALEKPYNHLTLTGNSAMTSKGMAMPAEPLSPCWELHSKSHRDTHVLPGHHPSGWTPRPWDAASTPWVSSRSDGHAENHCQGKGGREKEGNCQNTKSAKGCS